MLKQWIETVYRDHGMVGVGALVFILLVAVLGLAKAAGLEVSDAWQLIMGWLNG